MDWYPKRRFVDLADEMAARLPDAEGLVFEQARYTFRQIAQRIDDAAKRLIVAGVGHGDHVALWLNNCDTWIFTGVRRAQDRRRPGADQHALSCARHGL